MDDVELTQGSQEEAPSTCFNEEQAVARSGEYLISLVVEPRTKDLDAAAFEAKLALGSRKPLRMVSGIRRRVENPQEHARAYVPLVGFGRPASPLLSMEITGERFLD
jgi:hypothetical protein